ncbi:MAG TPA: R3H domain-containing nucleic acid-binding protein [Caldisericia bacterium]|nr:R3H domain-containing nucleic acid-binding protein [Caldisericia bacterium]HPF48878.1 R3H domain-containing nucleic acid-binding protein [Caldisericia bacterium]HPI83258.1 R3H domain-containing nucleic acid-binding protein [Caldisericia bacterium]HPQ92485.1 R3H domain-containing nucleic acid-binding protein [Caldisericia bacterium]HRV74417.1 R3H domain-containing nucleic acid-binding protein [Caldisericia bacterium]
MANSYRSRQQETQAKEILSKFLPELFQKMGEDIHIRMHHDIDTLFLSVDMEEPAVFIGKSGECLAALQYLVNMILQQKGLNQVRITLDIGGYKRRQIDILRNIAQNAALKVKRYGRPVELQPMSAFARRIIHTTLKDNPYVITHSIDEEPQRRIIVDIKS